MSGNNNYTGKANTGRRAYASSQSSGRRLSGEQQGSWLVRTTAELSETLHDHSRGFDMPLFIIIVALLVIGLLSMYSASYAYAYQYYKGNSNYFIIRQATFAALGFVIMLGVSLFPTRWFKKWLKPLMAGSAALLVLVLFLPKIEYVHRWINLGFTTFQPSEIAKFAVILFCAYWAEKQAKLENNFKNTVLPYMLVAGATCVLLVLEPHISCIILVLLITVTIMFVAGVRLKWFAVLGVPTIGILTAVVFSGIIPYSRDRVNVWIDPFVDKYGKGWQNIQALYAISSGGLLGVGMGNSRQKYLYISEPQNDFVFSVVCEELGFVGAVVIILLFLAFVLRGIAVSASNPNRFCKMLGIGITAQIGWQVFLNIAVVTKTIPNTGISLPFFSYGGTSLVMLLFEMGVLLALSRTSTAKRIF